MTGTAAASVLTLEGDFLLSTSVWSLPSGRRFTQTLPLPRELRSRIGNTEGAACTPLSPRGE